MKKLILIFLLTVFYSSVSAQLRQDANGKYIYDTVVYVSGINDSKDDLYKYLKDWVTAEPGGFENDSIIVRDKQDGQIEVQCHFVMKEFKINPSIKFVMGLYVKDSRYRCVLKDIDYVKKPGETLKLEEYSMSDKIRLLGAIDGRMRIIIYNLVDYVKEMTTPVLQKDDW